MSRAAKSDRQRGRMGRVCRGVLLGAALLGGSSLALAQDPHPAAAEAAQPPVEVIFTGFARRADKSASIFVRMTAEVPVAVDRTGRRLVYRLSGARLGVANNANPLPTELFGPPVSHVALVPANGNVDLVIDLTDSNEALPAHRFVSSGGLATLQVDLPAAAANSDAKAEPSAP
jgi:hypothetical protein